MFFFKFHKKHKNSNHVRAEKLLCRQIINILYVYLGMRGSPHGGPVLWSWSKVLGVPGVAQMAEMEGEALSLSAMLLAGTSLVSYLLVCSLRLFILIWWVAKKLFFHSPLWRVNFQIYSPDQTSARHICQLLLNPLANDKIRMYNPTQLEIAPPSFLWHFERLPHYQWQTIYYLNWFCHNIQLRRPSRLHKIQNGHSMSKGLPWIVGTENVFFFSYMIHEDTHKIVEMRAIWKKNSSGNKKHLVLWKGYT